ncbi:hypothetical protein ACIRRH_33600 [Kitasatospora sp. NPDC101235]|uniref:hypothetical protein n=1 Tax=Kitasatospora sp. NPDC101235 TaxID=3364101 RepID=UPI003816B3FC
MADYGFTPIPGSTGMAFTGRTDSLILHARQTVAALRATGAEVHPDPSFDYTPGTHPGHPSPSSLATAPGAQVVTPGRVLPQPPPPTAGQHPDVAVGRHPEHGITATNSTDSPAAVQLLAQAGFYRVPNHPSLYSLTRPEAGGIERATDTVARLRAAGLTVASDAAFDPDHAPGEPGEAFRTHLVKIADNAETQDPSQDPFATRIFPAPRQEAGAVKPVVGLDPFATQLRAAPDRAGTDSRMGALLSNRQDTLVAVQEILAALDQQLRDDPQALDPEQVSAVLDEAQTTLGGVRRDLATISAAAPARAARPVQAARPTVAPELGARAQAATATSLRLGRVTATQPVEAAARPVDPRRAYGIHTR